MGEYLNGKKNGKGKQSDIHGYLVFVGDYENGKKLKGKEYGEGTMIFEGEYVKGKRSKGKEYYSHDTILYYSKVNI